MPLRALSAVVVAVLLAACASSAASSDDGVTAVATVYPLAWLTQQIAPDAEVVSLASGGGDAHDAELTPQQRVALERADVVVHVGNVGFQPHVEQALPSAAGQVVAAADAFPDQNLLTDGAGATDPHLWFDARAMAQVATAVAAAFAEADAAHAAEYRANAEQAAATLRDLADAVDARLKTCEHDRVVVGHEAFRYLLEPHGLEQVGISPPGEHGEATPQRVAELVEVVRNEDLPAVLSEPAEGRAGAETVAHEAGVPVIDIASLDVVSDEQAAAGLPDLIREQADAVAEAAGCAA